MLKNKRSKRWALAFAIALLAVSGFKSADYYLNLPSLWASSEGTTLPAAVHEDEAKPTQDKEEEPQGPIHLSGTTQVTRVP